MQVMADDAAKSPARLMPTDWCEKFEKETKVSPSITASYTL